MDGGAGGRGGPSRAPCPTVTRSSSGDAGQSKYTAEFGERIEFLSRTARGDSAGNPSAPRAARRPSLGQYSARDHHYAAAGPYGRNLQRGKANTNTNIV